MTKVTNNFVSYNIVTDKVVSNNMKTIVHDRKNSVLFLLVEICANLKYNCKITQTSFCAKYSGLVFMEMRVSFRAVFHPAGDRLDTRRGCAPSLPGMAHIPAGQRWRTSPADTEKAFSGGCKCRWGASCNAIEISYGLCRDLAHDDAYFASVWQPAICFPFFVWICGNRCLHLRS